MDIGGILGLVVILALLADQMFQQLEIKIMIRPLILAIVLVGLLASCFDENSFTQYDQQACARYSSQLYTNIRLLEHTGNREEKEFLIYHIKRILDRTRRYCNPKSTSKENTIR